MGHYPLGALSFVGRIRECHIGLILVVHYQDLEHKVGLFRECVYGTSKVMPRSVLIS